MKFLFLLALIPLQASAFQLLYNQAGELISYQYQIPISGWTSTSSGTLTAPPSESQR